MGGLFLGIFGQAPDDEEARLLAVHSTNFSTVSALRAGGALEAVSRAKLGGPGKEDRSMQPNPP
jgi:hypothetical protein